MMSLFDWLKYSREHLFKAEDGFYELPNLSNSPKILADSLAALPVMVHYRSAQILSTNNTYFAVTQRYFEIQEGLWLTATDFYV